jgi:asparagine N-glycosylation enzyme membrane subunit Stt3
MQPASTAIEHSENKRHSVWVVIWVFLALVLASDSVIEMWGAWGLEHKVRGLALLFVLVAALARLFWKRRSGKDVNYIDLSCIGYAATVAAVLAFAHR